MDATAPQHRSSGSPSRTGAKSPIKPMTRKLDETKKDKKPALDYFNPHLKLSAELDGACGRKALLIGLGFQGFPEEWGIPHLGSVNDCLAMRAMLIQHYGFRNEDIQMFLDDKSALPPTRENILNALKWLCSGSACGDALVLYYAGHGTSIFVTQNPNPESYGCLCASDGLVLMSEIWNETQYLASGTSLVCIIDSPFGEQCLDVGERLPDTQDEVVRKMISKTPFRDRPKQGARGLGPRQPPPWFSVDHFPETIHPLKRFPKNVNGFVLAACLPRQFAGEGPNERTRLPGGIFTSCTISKSFLQF